MNEYRGYISREYTAWCGVLDEEGIHCPNWEQTGTCFNKSQAIRKFKRRGWKNTRKYGWVCPAHAKG